MSHFLYLGWKGIVSGYLGYAILTVDKQRTGLKIYHVNLNIYISILLAYIKSYRRAQHIFDREWYSVHDWSYWKIYTSKEWKYKEENRENDNPIYYINPKIILKG